MNAPVLAPSLVRLRARVDELWPQRDRRSDGWLGDAAHRRRRSDHNPDARGIVHALDVTTRGIDRSRLLDDVIGHPAVNYVIHAGMIWSRVRDFRAVPYTGPNPHDHHAHVSILHTSDAERYAGAWLPEEDDMPLSAGDLAKIRAMVVELLDERDEQLVAQLVARLLGTTIPTFFDKNGDGRRDPETVAQALGGGHSEAYFTRVKADELRDRIAELRQLVEQLAGDPAGAADGP